MNTSVFGSLPSGDNSRMNPIREIVEFNRYVVIAGFKNVKITDRDNLISTIQGSVKNACLQFFNAASIAGWEHLFFAALNALKAFDSNINISKSLAIETLLFASAQRQIKKAVKLLGINSESSQVVVLVITNTQKKIEEVLETVSELISGERDDSVIELTNEKVEVIKRLFGISEIEFGSKVKNWSSKRKALVDLVIEHIALLVTQR